MSYLQSIKRLNQEDNLGGINQIRVCRKSEVESIPDPVSRIVYGNIVLKAGATFVTFDVTLETARIQGNSNVTREGNSKRYSFPFVVAKAKPAVSEMFDVMQEDEFIVVFTENGRQKVFGLLHAPLRFSYSHDSGAQVADRNNYECRFYYDGPDNVYFYEGALAAPAGPAPALVKINGVVVASLAPGETANLVSDYTIDYIGITIT